MCPATRTNWNRSLSQHDGATHMCYADLGSLLFGNVRASSPVILRCPPPRTAEAKVFTARKPMAHMPKIEAENDHGTFRPLFDPWSMRRWLMKYG